MKRSSRVVWFGGRAVALLLAALAGACQSLPRPADGSGAGGKRYEYVRPKMGTGFRIVLYAPDPKTADAAAEAAFARIDQLNSTLSDYDPNSELSRLSQRTLIGPMPEPVKVGDDLWNVLEQSLTAAQRSGGAFDVTIGPCVKLWRRARDMGELPTPERLDAARQAVGYRFLKLDPRGHTVQLLAPKMRLDVGGIAKGYAAEQALAEMRKLGVSRAMVGAAGDLAVGVPPPGRTYWRVAIDSLPADPATRPAGDGGGGGESGDAGEATGGAYVRLSRYAISTSGDTERFIVIDGRRYSHILDPRTGLGLTSRIGVTVIAPDGTTADWMATALSVLGPEKGLALIESTPGAAARIVTLDGGHSTVFESRRFREFLDDLPELPAKAARATTFPSRGDKVK